MKLWKNIKIFEVVVRHIVNLELKSFGRTRQVVFADVPVAVSVL